MYLYLYSYSLKIIIFEWNIYIPFKYENYWYDLCIPIWNPHLMYSYSDKNILCRKRKYLSGELNNSD